MTLPFLLDNHSLLYYNSNMANLIEAYKLFHEGSLTLAKVESNGIKVDTEYLDRAIEEKTNRIEEIKSSLMKDKIFKDWKNKYGDRTNIGSNLQLGDVLFNLRKVPCYDFTPTGRPKTSEKALSIIAHPFVEQWIEMVHLRKLIGTFLKGLKRETVNGYFHPNFNLHSTTTYRSSSGSDQDGSSMRGLNFQNLPVRNPVMSEAIRSCFIPRKNQQIAEIDFSGIEVRIAAVYTKDPTLINYIKDPTTDMHRDTAMQLFLLKENQVSKKGTRYVAKNQMVFPQFYGSVYFQCAPQMWESMERMNLKVEGEDTTIREHLKKNGVDSLGDCTPGASPYPGTFSHLVKRVEQDFWTRRFKVYSEWKEKWWNSYLKRGYFDYLTGFRVSGHYSRNEVLNFAIQGTAFHCLLWSVIQLQKWLKKYRMKTKLLGQIHDSKVLDLHPKEADDVLHKAKSIMTVELPKHWEWICVPLEVEVEASPTNQSWHKKEIWIENNIGWGPKLSRN